MRPTLSKSKSEYPKLRALYAIPSVALTMVIMAYSGLFGMIPILVLYGIWFPLIFYKGRLTLRLTKDIYGAFILAVYVVSSVLWSDYPEITARAALEFASMIVCTIIMSRVVETESFVKGVILGAIFVLASTIVNGTYGRDYFTGEYTLVGLLGSKNQVGLFAEIGFFTSLIYMFAARRIKDKILYSLCPLMFFSFCLYLSHSATSVASLTIVLAVTYSMYGLTKISVGKRKIVFAIGAIFAVIIVMAAIAAEAEVIFLDLLGKNATLTGRTYLWGEGIKNGLNNPILGDGYAAFWVPGRLAAEQYWFQFQMFGRTGFHFHDLYIQTFVDLGAIGLFIMLYLIFSNCTKSLRLIIRNGAGLEMFFCLGMALMFLIRAFVEVDFLGPFTIGCMLFYSIAPRLAAQVKEDSTRTPAKSRAKLIRIVSNETP